MTRDAGTESTITAKKSEPWPPGARSATACVHGVPGGLPSAHDQPGVLAARLKWVEPGTVSVTTTPVARPEPMLP